MALEWGSVVSVDSTGLLHVPIYCTPSRLSMTRFGAAYTLEKSPSGLYPKALRNATVFGLFAEEYVDSWLNPCDMPSLNAAPALLWVLSTR